MATVPKQLDESPVGRMGRRWTALCDWLKQISPLFILVAYVVISAVVWVGAATVAMYRGTALPGVAGGWSSSRKVDGDEPDRGKQPRQASNETIREIHLMIDVDSIRRRTVLKASAITTGALTMGTPASASEEGNGDGARSTGRSSGPICGDDEAFETHTVSGGGGIDIHVDETGNENGQPILFIHGASLSRLQWAKQMRSNLAGPFRLVAPDLRGHGDSDKPEDAYGASELWAADIQAVIDELDLDNPVLVGVSSGSEWISDYLRVEGENDIAGVNMVSAAPLIEVEDPTEILHPEWLEFLQSGVLFTDDAEDSIGGIHDWIPFLTNEPVTPTDRALLVGVIATAPPRVRAAVFGRSGTTTYEDVLADLDVPVLVSHGEADELIRKAHAEMVAETIPNAETSFYPEAGHALNMDNACRFNRELRKFVVGL